MKTATLSLVTLLILNSVGIFAQADAAATEKDFITAYDAYVRRTMEKISGTPAVAIVIIKDDKPIFVRGYGFADIEAGKKADADSLFYIGSSTKSFTALAAAILDREGKIKLADPIIKYADGIQFKTPLPDKVTVRDLLTHTSGLRNSPLVFRTAFSGQIDPKEIKGVFAENTTFSDANFGKYAYTNLGYNVYALLLEYHLNRKWQDELQKRIFDPLGMKHTTAYRSRAAKKKLTLAAPYYFSGQDGKMVRSPLDKTDNNMQAAGGVFASISDIGRWIRMNMNDGRLNGKQVIPSDVVRSVHTGYTKTTRDAPPFSGDGEYGLGWQIGRYKNEKVVYHHGGYVGYQSHISFMPERRIGVAVLTNDGAAGGRIVHMMATYAYDRLLKSPTLEADFTKLLDDFAAEYKRGTQGMITAAADRAKRTSQLTMTLSAYTGKFFSDSMGLIEVTINGNDLAVRLGNMSCVSTPFTTKDTIRVELMPGSGEVIEFRKNAAERIESLTYAGAIFTRRN